MRIEALPDKTVVFNDDVTKSLTLDLDPGKYIACAISHDKASGGYHAIWEFLHEVTEEQWKELHYRRPKMATTIQTSRGIVWKCHYFGCEEDTTSKIAALAHEASHFGIDLFGAPLVAKAADQALAQAEDQASKQVKAISNVRDTTPLNTPLPGRR